MKATKMGEKRVLELLLEERGFCVHCGSTSMRVEPDAKNVTCEECGNPGVFGMEEAIVRGYIVPTEEKYPNLKEIRKKMNKNIIIDNIHCSYINISPIHGHGLFAKENIPPSIVLGVLNGQIVSWDDYEKIKSIFSVRLNDNDLNYLFMEWNALDEKTLLVRPFRTKYSFINHSFEPNLIVKYFPLRIESLKHIKKDEELFLDYTREPLRKEYLKEYEKKFLRKK